MGAADTRDPEDATTLEGVDVARLVADNERMAKELRGLRAGGPGLTPTSQGTLAKTPKKAQSATVEPKKTAADTLGIDWERFATALEEALPLIPLAKESPDASALTPEQRMKLMRVMSEMMTVSTMARAVSPRPFFDERILPHLVDALYSRPLGLSTEQAGELKKLVKDVLTKAKREQDIERSSPNENYRLRHQINHRLRAALDEQFPDNPERLQEIGELADNLLLGSMQIRRIGIKPDGDRAKALRRITSHWKDTLALTPQQVDSVQGAAATFLSGAEDVLRRHDAYQEGVKIDDAMQKKLDERFLALQLEAEKSFEYLLTEAQRTNRANQSPSLLAFHYGEGESSTYRDSGGF